MKAFAITLLALFITTPGFAQQTPEQTALTHRGQLKIWSGAILMGVGAIVVPVTAANESGARGVSTAVGVALLSAGGGLLWSGTQDQRKATRPTTTYGILVGERRGLHVQRSW